MDSMRAFVCSEVGDVCEPQSSALPTDVQAILSAKLLPNPDPTKSPELPSRISKGMGTGSQESGLDLTSTQSTQSSSPGSVEDAGAETYFRVLTTEFETRLDKLESRLTAFADTEFEARLDKLESCLTAFTEEQTKACQQLQVYMSRLETSTMSQQGLAMEEIARIERICAQLELACQETRDEAFPVQTQMVQFQAQLLALEVQFEGLRGQWKAAASKEMETPTETEKTKQESKNSTEGDRSKIVDQPQVEEYDDAMDAIRALDAELKIARSECQRMALLIDHAAKDFLWCRNNSDALLEDVKGLVGRLEGLQASTDAAHLQLEGTILGNVAVVKSETDSLRGSVAEVKSDARATLQELERIQGVCTKLELRGEEIGQLRQALDNLQERVQNLQAKGEPEVSSQALSSLQGVVQQLILRVDRLVPSEAVRVRAVQRQPLAVIRSVSVPAAMSAAHAPRCRSLSPTPMYVSSKDTLIGSCRNIDELTVSQARATSEAMRRNIPALATSRPSSRHEVTRLQTCPIRSTRSPSPHHDMKSLKQHPVRMSSESIMPATVWVPKAQIQAVAPITQGGLSVGLPKPLATSQPPHVEVKQPPHVEVKPSVGAALVPIGMLAASPRFGPRVDSGIRGRPHVVTKLGR